MALVIVGERVSKTSFLAKNKKIDKKKKNLSAEIKFIFMIIIKCKPDMIFH